MTRSEDTNVATLPDGITSHLIREYKVGPYRYTDLDQAIAELERQKGQAKT
jgi:hypothetical protein